MVLITTILWLISGISSFIWAVKKIWGVLDIVIATGEAIFKFDLLVGMFLRHVIGGVFSLIVMIYHHFHGD